ncbi:hypothetical protein SpCBS45565_g05931 [Spizellomyces sp. 'palustris']|nr:hypothetical protein SpCBS45565_g05931 [Spizellomyces sp. 'palustris']
MFAKRLGVHRRRLLNPFAPHISRRYLQVPVNQVKRGAVIELRDRIWVVNTYTHHTQGRGGAHYKFDLRDVTGSGKTLERFNSGQTVEVVELDTKELQFLYLDDQELHLLDNDTFEEHAFPLGIFNGGDKAIPFLQDGMRIEVDFHETKPVVVKMPERGTYTVIDTPPVASSGTNESKGTMFKNATLDSGAHVMVPEFVNIGDKIVVDLGEYRYVTRAK